MKSTHMHYKALKPSQEVVRASQLSFIEWCSLFGIDELSGRRTSSAVREEGVTSSAANQGDGRGFPSGSRQLYSMSHLLNSGGGVLSRDCVISV